MSYQFAGIGFNTESAAINEMVTEFISAGGANSRNQIAEWLDDAEFPADCAHEILDAWDCNIGTGECVVIPTFAQLEAAISALTLDDFTE